MGSIKMRLNAADDQRHRTVSWVIFIVKVSEAFHVTPATSHAPYGVVRQF
jgi:hypothetical protein